MRGKLSRDEQLRLWLSGVSACPNEHEECCPDFSCCHPSLRADLEVRKAFVEGDAELRERLCWTFLGALLKDTDPTAYLAGRPVDDA